MISLELARRLRAAGVRWDPQPGDRFVIPDRDMDDDVFVVSTMVVDVYDAPAGRIIRFNGTVEWALDSVAQDAALWLPSEGQLRGLLGGAFVELTRDDGRYRVTVDVAGRRADRTATDAAEAYGQALLFLATGG